jgi:signal transduction histidine kinase
VFARRGIVARIVQVANATVQSAMLMTPIDRCYTTDVIGHRALAVLAGAIALGALGWGGSHVLARDRDAMYTRFAHERKQGIDIAARAVASDLDDVGRDLELAAALLRTAETPRVAERELNAIATIKREYLAMAADTPNGVTRVVALDSPAGVGELAAPVMSSMLARAEETPDHIRVSGALGPPDTPAAWYRVFARRPAQGGPPVAVVVDMAIALGRDSLQRDSTSRVAVVTPGGIVPSASNPKLAALISHRPSLATPDPGETLDSATAEAIGLPRTRAVVTSVPMHIDGGDPWRLVEVTSTSALAAQERMLVGRVLVAAAVVLVLLMFGTRYVVRNARRSAMLNERLRQADRLAHLTEKAEKILDHIPSGVIAISDDRRVTAANRRFVERFHDITGHRLEDAFEDAPAEDVGTLIGLIELATTTRMPQSIHRAQFRLLGDDAYFSIHVVPLARSVADVDMLVVFDDLTQLRRIEDQLLRSEKLVTAGQLAAGIAHEIGTPLSIARARVELALSHLGAQHTEAASQQVVLDQIDRVTRLIQQLLDYVRSAPAAIQQVDAVAAMRAVSELLAPQATQRGVTLWVDDAAVMPLLRADPDQVQQILVNLVLNAIDACDRGGRVELRAAMRDGNAVLEISDNGHGIPREIQAQVFDPFFTTKKRGQGTGLGLWVVAQLARAHAAELELDSAPGAGTTIRVAWPVAA